MGIFNVFGGIVGGLVNGIGFNGIINKNVIVCVVGMMVFEIIRNVNILVLGDIVRFFFGNILVWVVLGIIGNIICNIVRFIGLF